MLMQVKRLRPEARLPAYAHPGDAGMDLCAAEDVLLRPGRYALVPTGLAVALPPGTEGQLRPRSGLAMRHGITLLNTPGTIDEGYRGEVGVLLINHGAADFTVETGMRIAQLVIHPVVRAEITETDALAATRRGANGFGSTGTHTPV